jgi:hypothetical protein
MPVPGSEAPQRPHASAMKRRYIIAILVTLVVLGFAFVAFGFWRARQPKPDIARDLFGSQEALTTFTTAHGVTAQRLHFRFRDGQQYSTKLKDYEHDAPVAVSAEHVGELRKLLLQESSYWWRDGKACLPRYGVVFTFQAEQAPVRVALCFDCNLLGIYDSTDNAAENVNREKDFDPIRRQLVLISKSIFPADAVIQALNEARHTLRSDVSKNGG